MDMQFNDAIKTLAKELKNNPGYFGEWQKGMTSAVVVEIMEEVNEKGVEPTYETLLIMVFNAAGRFLDSVVYASETEHGWVYRK